MLLASEPGAFGPNVTYSTDLFTNMVLADLDGDGKRDIAVVTLLGAAVPFGTGDGGFRPAVTYTALFGGAQFPYKRGFAAADLTGDRRPDLIVDNHILLARCVR